MADIIPPSISERAKFEDFPNIGLMFIRFTEQELKPVIDEINKIKENFNLGVPMNYSLAGNIKHEYKLFDSVAYLDTILVGYVINYIRKYDLGKKADVMLQYPEKIKIGNVWANYQQKHEFNPVHCHSGVVSFVIWLDIPYKSSDEVSLSGSDKSNYPVAGKFSFLYSDSLGGSKATVLPVDRDWNLTVCLFPSQMNHVVYPFYSSDDYRITISGNYFFDY